jgi:hypothetical protein
MDKNKFFVIGGVSSFALYGFVLAVLLLSLSNFQKIRKVAIKSEQSAIEVSIEEKTTETAEQIPTLPVPPTPAQPQKEIKQPIQKQQPEALTPTKLTKNIVKQESKPQIVQQAQPPKEKLRSANDFLSDLAIKKNNLNISFSGTGEKDEYLQKVAEIIKQRWVVLASDTGNSATIQFTINKNGTFTYRLSRGNNQDFNNRLVEYAKSLQKNALPPPPSGKEVVVEFNFNGTR